MLIVADEGVISGKNFTIFTITFQVLQLDKLNCNCNMLTRKLLKKKQKPQNTSVCVDRYGCYRKESNVPVKMLALGTHDAYCSHPHTRLLFAATR